MNKVSFRRVPVAAIVLAVIAPLAAADPPDILRDYRLVTSHSTVHVSGGLPGYDMDLAITGRFGVATGYDYGVDPTGHVPTLVPHAEFVDVKAILFNPLSLAPLPLPGWDLDKTLDLTGLTGTFRTGDMSRLFFEGVDGQGAPIKLEAAVHDSLIHIVGANDPHCTTCSSDFLGYKIDALGFLWKSTDFNSNGLVDTADYVQWRKTPMTATMSDDGSEITVDSVDYLDVWRVEFGQITSSGANASGASLSEGAVPEPATPILLMFAGASWCVRRCRIA